MLETSFESPLEKMRKEDWARLTAEEKAFCLNYERITLRDGKATWAMVNRMTALYEKYPDINVNACIPRHAKVARNSEGNESYNALALCLDQEISEICYFSDEKATAYE